MEMDTHQRKDLILKVLTRFSSKYSETIHGRYTILESGEVQGGARINYIFNEVFRKKILSINPFLFITDERIRVAIRNTNGLNPSLLVSEAAFEMLIKDQIGKNKE